MTDLSWSDRMVRDTGGRKLPHTNTHLEQFAQSAEILARHGLGFLAGTMGLERWLPGHTTMPTEEPASPVRLRLVVFL